MASASTSNCLGSRSHFCSSRSAPVRSTRVAVTHARSLACSSQFHLANWQSSRETAISLKETLSTAQAPSGAPRRQVVRLGNKATGGPFSPLVVVVRNVVGDKEFNKLRGKAISLHSQIIKDFCKQLGVDNRQVQGVIRLAKKNGEKLGFLA